MTQNEYYPEEVLVGKMQSGEYGDTNEYQSPADGLAARNAQYADA